MRSAVVVKGEIFIHTQKQDKNEEEAKANEKLFALINEVEMKSDAFSLCMCVFL